MSRQDEFWVTATADLARVGADAVASGLALASGGNLSARLPGTDEFIVTGKGTFLDWLEPADFVRMRLDGTALDADRTPSSEWRLHQRTYQERPDVNAIVHLHPEHAVLVDALGKPIRLLTLDHVAYVSRIARIDFYPNGSDELADNAAVAARQSDCVILAHHGCSTMSVTVQDAYRKALNLESAARATYRLLAVGDETTEFPPHLRATAIHQ